MARQLSYVYEQPSSPFVYRTIPDVVAQKSQQMPETEAFVHYRLDKSRESITYRKLHDESRKVAEFLINAGTMRGDTVGLLGSNSINRIVGEFGIIMAGGVVIHISPTLKDVSDIVELFSMTDCKSLFIDPGEDNGLHQVIDKTLKHGMIVESKVLLLRTCEKFASYSTIDWKISERKTTDCPLPVLDPEDPVVIFSTSGSTGQSKLVEHSHFNFVNHPIPRFDNAESNLKMYNDRPFGWAGGSPLWTFSRLNTRVFMDAKLSVQKGYSQTIWEIIEKEKCGYVFIVPHLVHDLIAVSEANECLYRVQNLIISGQIISGNLLKLCWKITKHVQVVLGTTETFLIACNDFLSTNTEACTLGCVGYALSGMEIKIVDDNEDTVELGKEGEICVRSTRNFKQYFNNSDLTARAFTISGWFKTGDIGYLSRDGQLTIQGRKFLRISRGTRKITPEVIEHHISQMAGIKKVIVVPVPDERLLEEVCVCFVPMAGCNVDPAKVEEYCTETFLKENAMDSLGEKPKYYLQFPNIPELSNGKPDRQMVRIEAEQRVLTCLTNK